MNEKYDVAPLLSEHLPRCWSPYARGSCWLQRTHRRPAATAQSAMLRYRANVIIEKREQVFVSSTFLDLVEERQAIIQTLLQADCFPAGMELFPASDDEKWSLITRVIDDSDYYVLVLGGRYGSVGDDGLSFTEKEFDYAESTGKPIMAFLHGEPGEIAAKKTDMDDAARQKLDAFRAKASARMAKFWTTADGLAGQVALSLIQTRKTHPAEGWIRAGSAMTPEVEREIAELRAQLATAERDLQTVREAGAKHEVDETLA